MLGRVVKTFIALTVVRISYHRPCVFSHVLIHLYTLPCHGAGILVTANRHSA